MKVTWVGFLWLLHDLEYAFEFYVGWYLTWPVALSLILASGLASFISRSSKPLLVTSVLLLTIYTGYRLVRWQHISLGWQLYQAAKKH